MFREIWSFVKESFMRIVTSRMFALMLIFVCMFSALIFRLFQLQIVQGEQYLNQYKETTLKTVSTVGTRGNIYSADGQLLAYNELQYNMTISDNGAYGTRASEINRRNLMLYQLTRLIEKYHYTVSGKYELALDAAGGFVYTSSSESAKERFIANALGKAKPSQLKSEQLTMSAAELFAASKARYAFDRIKDEQGNPLVLDDVTSLNMINILYTMRMTAYQKYQSSTIVENISKECMAEVQEKRGELQGVDIETVSVRRYNYAPYFSHIVGYTGKLQQAQLDELKKTDDSYALNDLVGVWGLEKSMEATLKGQKGEKSMYLDSTGNILETVSETSAKAGNNIYTTISVNDQIAVYHLLEQQMAGILATKIQEADDVHALGSDSSSLIIPVKDAYFQLINNNVLDYRHFAAADAGASERQIQALFESSRAQVLSQVEAQLNDAGAAPLSALPLDVQAYLVYIYDFMTDRNNGFIDTSAQAFRQSEAYQAWKEDRISLRDFLLQGIRENWLSTEKLQETQAYADIDTVYHSLSAYLMALVKSDSGFDKKIYKYMIANRVLGGAQLCRALYEQGVLKPDEAAYQLLAGADEHTVYAFFISKIVNLELTPAQLALDPCNGSVVITDVRTGKIKALVTYPGFDNNRINNADYLAKCNADLSLPLLNGATQTQLAPGSTFKPISSIASLEEGVITRDTIISCSGKYDVVTPNIRCWIWPSQHGEENIVDAIKNSCNYFFADLGHRLATDGSGNYSPELGLNRLAKYASLFGLNSLSGVELDEKEPHLSDSDPERSAMGQGTHAYNNVQLARYITAVANNGKLFKLSVLDKITDSDGKLLESIAPKLAADIEISQSTWNDVHTGLREVITEGVARNVFQGQTIPVAGKTGTAQEREGRGNHAVFVSYAPYENPEISVTVNIPYGYSSGNAASLANRVYNYYYGKDKLEDIMARNASGITSINVSD